MASPPATCALTPRRRPPLWTLALAALAWPSVGHTADEAIAHVGFRPSVLQPPPEAEVDAPGLPAIEVAFGAPARPLHRRAIPQLQVHTGALVPHGQFYRHARAGAAYGAGLAGEWRCSPCSAVRLLAAYTRAQFSAKEADLAGDVTVNLITLRADYVLGHRWYRPYLGVGIGVTPWHGDIAQAVAQRHNSGSGNALTGTVALGVDLNLVAHLALAPEIAWTPLGGSFNASLWGASLALRARI